MFRFVSFISLRPIDGSLTNLLPFRVLRRAELEHKEAARLGKKEEFAKRVALDLFRYLESFNQGGGHVAQISNDHLVVPANFLDRWFTKFQHKFRRDPDFLTRQTEKA